VTHKKRRPSVLSNISILTISVSLPVAVNNPVAASQVRFQKFRAIQRFCVKVSNKHSDRGHSSNNLELLTDRTFRKVRNQLGTPGGAKSFPRGAQMFRTMSNIFKLCPTHFSSGGENFCRGLSPLGYGSAFRASF